MNGSIYRKEYQHFQNSPATFKSIVTTKMQTRRSIQRTVRMKFIFLEDKTLEDEASLKTRLEDLQELKLQVDKQEM